MCRSSARLLRALSVQHARSCSSRHSSLRLPDRSIVANATSPALVRDHVRHASHPASRSVRCVSIALLSTSSKHHSTFQQPSLKDSTTTIDQLDIQDVAMATDTTEADVKPADILDGDVHPPAGRAEALLDPESDEDVPLEPEELSEALGRPPPVHSSYLPLPWKGRLGYVSRPAIKALCNLQSSANFNRLV